MYKFVIPALLTISTLSGCTSVQVKPLDASAKLSKVCIVENPKVVVTGFLKVVRDGFDEHNINTVVIKDYMGQDLSGTCQAILTYTAFQTWDIATYLRHAELRLDDLDGKKLASAEYHLIGGGGFSLMKWASVESKMKPVIDELLAAY
jgi:hypothetical protein